MKFEIKENQFDSGIIAPKVGELIIDDLSNIKKEDGREIKSCAKENGFNLVVLSSSSPVNLEEFSHLGVINEIEADINDVWNNLEKIPSMFNVRSLSALDWDEVKELLDIYPPNRYSKDPNLPKKLVEDHKLNILKLLAKNFPQYSLGLFSKENELVGFHFLRLVDSSSIYLQELLVRERYRVGFASLQLVKENIKLIKEDSNAKNLITRVYDDNNTSMSFFSRLGFKKLRKKEFYYHLWT